jgi:hypothetical protein
MSLGIGKSPMERALTLAALSGLKATLGPAFLATSRRSPERGLWVAAAAAEMVLDKLGVAPPRYRPALLIPHTLSGAWVARESIRDTGGGDENHAAMMGAVVAAGVACIAPLLRQVANKVLGVPDFALGLGEDYLALRAGSEVTDIPLERLPELVREAADDVGGRIRPMLHPVGVEV